MSFWVIATQLNTHSVESILSVSKENTASKLAHSVIKPFLHLSYISEVIIIWILEYPVQAFSDCTVTKIPTYVFIFWELRGLSPNFHIHVSVSDLYIPRISPHISCSRMGRSIVGIYKSLTNTWMWSFLTVAKQFLFWEYLSQISVLVLWVCKVDDSYSPVKAESYQKDTETLGGKQTQTKLYITVKAESDHRRSIHGPSIGLRWL
jgi:hypothetical protein